jgi:deoxyribodipyrimidine photo-lyase
MQAAAAERLAVRFEVVDSNGLLPLRAADKVYKRAVDFRRFLQKNLEEHLLDWPEESPLEGLDLPVLETLPELERWPAADEELLAAGEEVLAELPLDHEVRPVDMEGGSAAAEAVLECFLEERLDRYQDDRNAVSERATSELSPYLHFGHISTHRIFRDLVEREDWNPGQLGDSRRGAREGWWGMSPEVESYLDELITWREVGYNMTWQVDDYDVYESLPGWALETLEDHLGDDRPYLYTLEEFEQAKTHDEIWNAAQRELVRDGRIHNYLRMLWGKKILEWTAHPREALEVMIELNNKYALDGRNPNSYSGIFWCLGRYDRAWGPERPIFGKVRFMSSDSTRRKMTLKPYLEEYGEGSGQMELPVG